MVCPGPHAHLHAQDPESLPLPYQLFGAFHRLIRSNRQLMGRRLTEHGGHPGQTFCLRVLAETDGITQRDLAERLNVTRPTVTVMLQKMEKAGLVERRSDDADQRYTRIYLTKAGGQLHEEMHRQLDQMILDVVGPLSEKDQQELAAPARPAQPTTSRPPRELESDNADRDDRYDPPRRHRVRRAPTAWSSCSPPT